MIASGISWIVGALCVAGCLAGVAGGLFGIGGGIIMVPVLYYLFGVIGVTPDIQITLAIGTSLSVIIITSIRSLAAHHKTGLVDSDLLKAWLPWICIGSFGAGFLAEIIPTGILTIMFAAGALYIGISRIRPKKGIEHSAEKTDTSPLTEKSYKPRSHWADRVAPFLGALTGLISSLLGLGGGAAGVLIMGWTGRSMHQAVATASGFGLGVAIPGALGFILSGWGQAGLPVGALGFVYLPAFAILSLMTAVTAPMGARLAHRLPADRLSALFGGYILLVAMLMIRESIMTI